MMSNGSISGVFVASASNSMLLEKRVGPDLPHRNCDGQVSHAHQIAGGAGEGKYPVHFAYPAMLNLPHQRYRLQPAEAFFNPFPLLLTDGVTRVPRGAAINRAPPPRPRFCATCGVTRRLRHSSTTPNVSNPLSPPTVSGCVPGSLSIMISAASHSAVPFAWKTSPSTISPFRFSTNRFPL